MESAGPAGVATCRSFFSDIPGSGRTGNRAFISLPSDELEPLIMEVPHRRPTATRSLSGKNRCPLPEALFLGGRFFEFLFFVDPGVDAESRERMRRERAELRPSLSLSLSLSLLRDDTAMRCEGQLIKH